MERRRIGDTDLLCSPVGFGTWEMSTTMYGEIDVEAASRAVNAAIDHGINLFDTAEVYGPYHSERLLARALGARRREVVLVDKVGFEFDAEGDILGPNSSCDAVIEHSEGCLRRMRTDVIDLMLIHWRDHDTPLEETMGALEQLRADGKIRHYGVSNFDVAMMETCRQHGALAANQVGYHLFDRRMEAEVLPYCGEHRIGFMAYGTLAFGLLTGAFDAGTTFAADDWRSYMPAFGLPLFERGHFLRELRAGERLAAVAADYGRTLPQLAIAWVLGNPAVSVALVGMRHEGELEENLAASGWRLTEADRARIDRIFAEEGVPTNVGAAQLLHAP